MNQMNQQKMVVYEDIQQKMELSKFAARDYDRTEFANSVSILMSESAELQKCIQTRKGQISLYNALKYAGATGLSLNPMEGKACIIAYNGKAQYQIMKNGLVELVNESPSVRQTFCDTVREKDGWNLIKSIDGPKFEHDIAKTKRGEIVGFYAAIKFENGESDVVYMSVEQICEHRDNYSSNYNYCLKEGKLNQCVWHHSFEGQGQKTVLKKLCNSTHVSKAAKAAITGDEFDPEKTINVQVDQAAKSTRSQADDLVNQLNEKQKQPANEVKPETRKMGDFI